MELHSYLSQKKRVISSLIYRENTIATFRAADSFVLQSEKRMPNQFDRIIKEIFYQPTISLIKRVLGVQHLETMELPTELHKTLEKKVDMLFKACPPIGPPYLLVAEWQVRNDRKMALRMLFYYCMLRARYPDMEIRMYVIYIGKKPMNMQAGILEPDLQFKYDQLDLSKYSSETFLTSNIPEEVLLAILADGRQKMDRHTLVRKILFKLHKLLKNDPGKLKERLIQLEVLGQLRDLQSIIIKEKNNMSLSLLYNIKKDLRYKQGREENQILIAEKMLKDGVAVSLVQKYTGLPLERVKNIAGKLGQA